jgi:hypothetical protein
VIRVTIDQKGAVLRLSNLPKKATGALRVAITKEVITLANVVKAEKLSGQVLRNRSGALRRSVRAYPPGVEMTVIRGEVAADRVTSKYGKVHEYGGDVKIPAHAVRSHLRTSVLGKTYEVRAHSRRGHTAHFEERSFMRSALADRRNAIEQSIRKAVHEAVA